MAIQNKHKKKQNTHVFSGGSRLSQRELRFLRGDAKLFSPKMTMKIKYIPCTP